MRRFSDTFQPPALFYVCVSLPGSLRGGRAAAFHRKLAVMDDKDGKKDCSLAFGSVAQSAVDTRLNDRRGFRQERCWAGRMKAILTLLLIGKQAAANGSEMSRQGAERRFTPAQAECRSRAAV
jgi:hypothetical protein